MMKGTDGHSANTTAILLLTGPLVVGNRGPQAQILTAGEYRKAGAAVWHRSRPSRPTCWSRGPIGCSPNAAR